MKSISKKILLMMMLTVIACHARKHKRFEQEPLKLAFNLPENFGKTHFIVGYSSEEIEQLRKKEQSTVEHNPSIDLMCDGCVKQVFFSPDDNIQQILLHLIKNEKKSIRIAAFSFTDGQIAQALIDAHNKGINIEIVVDPSCMKDSYGKVALLQDNGLDVYIYNPNYKNNAKKSLMSSIQHNKVIILEQNVADKALVVTGSYNLTKSANVRNQENIVVLDDVRVIKKYQKYFELLKNRSQNQTKQIKIEKNREPILLSKKNTIFEDMVCA